MLLQPSRAVGGGSPRRRVLYSPPWPSTHRVDRPLASLETIGDFGIDFGPKRQWYLGTTILSNYRSNVMGLAPLPLGLLAVLAGFSLCANEVANVITF